MSEERNVQPRRRRRAQRAAEMTEILQSDHMPEDAAAERTEEPAHQAAAGTAPEQNDGRQLPPVQPEEAASPIQGADSRVPAKARQMSAAPYGEGGRIARRPGTRPADSFRRPEREMPARIVEHPVVRPERRAEDAGAVSGPEYPDAGAVPRMPESRVRIGYAPGRMSDGLTRQIPRRPEMPGSAPIRNYPENRYQVAPPKAEREPQAGHKARGKALRWIVAVLLVMGVLLIGVLALPSDNSIRVQAAELAEKMTGWADGLFREPPREAARINSFSVTGNEGIAPALVSFSVTTETQVEDLRLVDEDGRVIQTDLVQERNSEESVWVLTMRVESGYEGAIFLQAHRDDENWEMTDYSAQVAIAPPLTAAATAAAESVGETPVPSVSPEPVAASEPEAASEEMTEESSPALAEELQPSEEPSGEDARFAAEAPEDGEEPAADAEEATEEPTAEPTAVPTPVPTDTPEPTPEPTPTPPLEASAVAEANPELISTKTIYSGKKKLTEYSRSAKDAFHMPPAWEYSRQEIGVLTFRGNAFRTNGAVGTAKGLDTLSEAWKTEAGSIAGANITYHGIGWTGQPAIVKWSKQVRQSSNMYEEKLEKTGLKEVIIAGLDGSIRFFDLDDGTLTRNNIKLGYPMQGTPSVHPGGYPYMNVGQYARKMKNKTGKIGLRQYNLYTQKELTLIDGLDTGYKRAYNNIGSFETSALIDRKSDCVITAGTNGMLYLISLNSEFDWQVGSYASKPSTVVLTSRTKAQNRKNAYTAVESSVAMYDRYVYYADMGGVLRCVNTDILAPVWAVETEDAVMSAVALDLVGDDGIALYTANMLENRKSGDAQVRRFDALSGREIWKTEIGVSKDTKNKTDSGFKASPVIGEHALSGLVYYTVTGLNAAGQAQLGVADDVKAALIALDKETGEIRWAKGLSDRSESSPIAVYDESGNGRIIQCAWDGSIIMVDGLTGETVSEIAVEGNISASPAAFGSMMVVGTTGKGTSFVYGIRIE